MGAAEGAAGAVVGAVRAAVAGAAEGAVVGAVRAAVAGAAEGAVGAVATAAPVARAGVAVAPGPFLRLAAVAAGCVGGRLAVGPAAEVLVVVGGLGKPGAGLPAPLRKIVASAVVTAADFAAIAPQRKWVRGRGKLVGCSPWKDGLIGIGCSRFSPFARKRATRPLLLF